MSQTHVNTVGYFYQQLRSCIVAILQKA